MTQVKCTVPDLQEASLNDSKVLVGLLPKPMLMLVNSPGWPPLADLVSWTQSKLGQLSRSSRGFMAGPCPTPTGMGIDHWAPGIWTLSGHPGLPVPGTERLRLGTQPPTAPFFRMHPSKEAEVPASAGHGPGGYRGELRSCPQGNRHWESSVRRPKP